MAVEKEFDIGGSADSPIVPIIVGDPRVSVVLSHRLFRTGYNAAPVFFPAVARDVSRLRFFLTALHTGEQIRDTIEAVAEQIANLTSETN